MKAQTKLVGGFLLVAAVFVIGGSVTIARLVSIRQDATAEQAMADAATEARLQRVSERLSQTVAVSAGVLVVGTLLAGVLGYGLSRKAAGNDKAIAEFLARLQEEPCDVRSRLRVESEDPGDGLPAQLNRLLDRTQRALQQAQDSYESLTDVSTKLSASTLQVTNGAQDTNEKSSIASSSIQQMNEKMSSMTTASEQMSSNVKSVSLAVEQMTESISEVARNAEQAAGTADNAASLAEASNDKIADLGQAADEIGKVIEVIQDIAEQTNLLALNATIEAARAGDAGKGFAVVATEVKELAKQTANATEDIRRRIEGIQSSTTDAVHAIGEISEAIKRVNDVSRSIASAVEEQSITTKEIAQNVVHTATSAETVSMGVSESASATQVLLEHIGTIDHGAKDAAAGASETRATSEQLRSSVSKLQTALSEFRF